MVRLIPGRWHSAQSGCPRLSQGRTTKVGIVSEDKVNGSWEGGESNIFTHLCPVFKHESLLSFESYIFIHIRPRGSLDTADIKGSRPTARPLLLSRQRRLFGTPSGSVRHCHSFMS